MKLLLFRTQAERCYSGQQDKVVAIQDEAQVAIPDTNMKDEVVAIQDTGRKTKLLLLGQK